MNNWYHVPGRPEKKAADLALMGPAGTLFICTQQADGNSTNYPIFQLDKDEQWERFNSDASEISGNSKGDLWWIQPYTTFIGRRLAGQPIEPKLRGLGFAIGAGPTSVWLLGPGPKPDHDEIWYWNGNNDWLRAPRGAGTRIDVGPSGTPWLVNNAGELFKYDFQLQGWQRVDLLGLLPRGVADVAVGGINRDIVWIIGLDGTCVLKTAEPGSKFFQVDGADSVVGGRRIAADVNGNPWKLSIDGRIFRWTGQKITEDQVP